MKDSIICTDYIKTGNSLQSFVNDNDYTSVLSDYETRLRNDHQTIVDKTEEIRKAVRTLTSADILICADSGDKCINDMKSIKDKIEKSLLDFMSVLGDKQKCCKHKYRSIGHDSHYIYQICDRCGLQDRY